MRTIPQRNCLRTIATIPDTTRTTARIHRRVAMSIGPFASNCCDGDVAAEEDPVRTSTLTMQEKSASC